MIQERKPRRHSKKYIRKQRRKYLRKRKKLEEQGAQFISPALTPKEFEQEINRPSSEREQREKQSRVDSILDQEQHTITATVAKNIAKLLNEDKRKDDPDWISPEKLRKMPTDEIAKLIGVEKIKELYHQLRAEGSSSQEAKDEISFLFFGGSK